MRLPRHGVDSTEGNVSCLVSDEPWPRGRRSRRESSSTCSTVASWRARNSTVIATAGSSRCAGVDALDVNAWLVAEGWALAYRQYSVAYVEQESMARQSRRGMWRGEFVSPWDWRQGKRLRPSLRGPHIATVTGERQQGGLCRIKANISRNSGKRIYHMPGDRDYVPTRISVERGERWFCSESEARSAGWRRPGSSPSELAIGELTAPYALRETRGSPAMPRHLDPRGGDAHVRCAPRAETVNSQRRFHHET